MSRRTMNLTELRERAERAIAEGRAALDAGLDAPKALELAHLIEELRIYQAELELQNEELNQAQDQLARAKERYRRLFNDLPVPALVIDGSGFIAEANDQACRALGLSPSASLRRGALARLLMPPDGDRLTLRLRNLETSGPPARLESMHLRADGGVACYDLHLMPLVVEPDSEPQTLVVLIDRSAEEALKSLSAELMQSKLAAEQASAAKSSFLANMGHELRTPLNALLGLSQLLLDGSEGLSPRQRDYLAKIHAAAKALADLLNDILDYSKLADGRLKLESIALSIEDLLNNTRRLFAPVAESKGLRFECIADPRIPDLLVGDPLRIQQVLNHLVDNALKFTERGEVRVWVEQVGPSSTDPSAEGSEGALGVSETCLLRFTVSDTGKGMTPEQRRDLFTPLPNAEGTGLGLGISRRLVELMGGRMGVESRLGEGSKIWFQIPLRLLSSPYPLAAPGTLRMEPKPIKPASGPSLAPAELSQRIKLLAQLLAEHRSRARLLSAELEQGLQGTELETAYAPIAQAIKRLDFDTALVELERLGQALG